MNDSIATARPRRQTVPGTGTIGTRVICAAVVTNFKAGSHAIAAGPGTDGTRTQKVLQGQTILRLIGVALRMEDGNFVNATWDQAQRHGVRYIPLGIGSICCGVVSVDAPPGAVCGRSGIHIVGVRQLYPAGNCRVHAIDIHREFTVDVHPYVIVAIKGQLLATAEGEPVTGLRGEMEVLGRRGPTCFFICAVVPRLLAGPPAGQTVRCVPALASDRKEEVVEVLVRTLLTVDQGQGELIDDGTIDSVIAPVPLRKGIDVIGRVVVVERINRLDAQRPVCGHRLTICIQGVSDLEITAVGGVIRHWIFLEVAVNGPVISRATFIIPIADGSDEVAIDNGKHRLFKRFAAGKTSFHGAVGGAAIAVTGISVVTAFCPKSDPVSASFFTVAVAAYRLERAQRGATVAGIKVAVVAILRTFLNAVATGGTTAGPSRTRALETTLKQAARRAPIAAVAIVIVALFKSGDNAIAASQGAACSAHNRTMVPGLQLAVPVTAIAVDLVLVVAGFTAADDSVTTLDSGLARCAGSQARITRLDAETVPRTAIPGICIAVVTGFTQIERAISAVDSGGWVPKAALAGHAAPATGFRRRAGTAFQDSTAAVTGQPASRVLVAAILQCRAIIRRLYGPTALVRHSAAAASLVGG